MKKTWKKNTKKKKGIRKKYHDFERGLDHNKQCFYITKNPLSETSDNSINNKVKGNKEVFEEDVFYSIGKNKRWEKINKYVEANEEEGEKEMAVAKLKDVGSWYSLNQDKNFKVGGKNWKSIRSDCEKEKEREQDEHEESEAKQWNSKKKNRPKKSGNTRETKSKSKKKKKGERKNKHCNHNSKRKKQVDSLKKKDKILVVSEKNESLGRKLRGNRGVSPPYRLTWMENYTYPNKLDILKKKRKERIKKDISYQRREIGK